MRDQAAYVKAEAILETRRKRAEERGYLLLVHVTETELGRNERRGRRLAAAAQAFLRWLREVDAGFLQRHGWAGEATAGETCVDEEQLGRAVVQGAPREDEVIAGQPERKDGGSAIQFHCRGLAALFRSQEQAIAGIVERRREVIEKDGSEHAVDAEAGRDRREAASVEQVHRNI